MAKSNKNVADTFHANRDKEYQDLRVSFRLLQNALLSRERLNSSVRVELEIQVIRGDCQDSVCLGQVGETHFCSAGSKEGKIFGVLTQTHERPCQYEV